MKSIIGLFVTGLSVLFVLSPMLSAEDIYQGPYVLVATKDGSTIYCVNYDANNVGVINVGENKLVGNIPVGVKPNGAALSPDQKTLYVTSGEYRSKIQAVDLAAKKVVKEIVGGHTPTGPAITPDGKKLFVCNRFNAEVAEYSLPDLTLVRKIKLIREPRVSIVTPDGKSLYVANFLPDDPNNDHENPDAMIDVATEISVVDIASGQLKKSIRFPNGSHSLHGMCLSPDGRYLYVTKVLARFQMPTTQVDRGWMNTNGFSIIDTTKLEDENGGYVNTVLVDDVDLGASNLWGIAVSADGKQLYAAVSGSHEIAVVDAEAMHKKLSDMSEADAQSVPNELAFLVGMKKRIKLEGHGPRPLVVVGSSVYVGMYFSDTVQKVDLSTSARPAMTEIALGPKPEWSPKRRGEMHWNDATMCFQFWQSCASCHPDARMDGLNWDLLNDKMGNPKNAKSLLWCYKTPPAMWEGVRSSSEHCTRTGVEFILFTQPDEAKCLDMDAYLHSLEPLESPYLVDGKLSEKAERGRKIFEDAKVGCAKCHPAPLFTDMKMHDVNSRTYFDKVSSFDTPTLIEIWRTAPYLHDGRYPSMKDVFKIGNHGDVNGGTDHLTDEQLDDLVEYIMSL